MMMGFGLVWMLFFWGLLVLMGVLLVRWLFPGWEGRRPADPTDPLHILQMRYARGEITREQYEQMRRDLEATR